jgi:hypothetical protein
MINLEIIDEILNSNDEFVVDYNVYSDEEIIQYLKKVQPIRGVSSASNVVNIDDPGSACCGVSTCGSPCS